MICPGLHNPESQSQKSDPGLSDCMAHGQSQVRDFWPMKSDYAGITPGSSPEALRG